MNNYGYHRVPNKMQGSILLSLNQLKESNADLYQQYIQKYKGREGLLTAKLTCFNCLWNDVIFLSPIHPYEIYSEIRKTGFKINNKHKWYKIPLDALEQSNLAVSYSKRAKGDFKGDIDCVPLSSVDIGDISSLPIETKEYYRECVEKGKTPLTLARAPHLLYRGEIDISGFEVIEV